MTTRQSGATTRHELHALIDALPEPDLVMAKQLLEQRHALAADPMLLALITAPVDSEPSQPGEDAAEAEGWGQYRRGEFVTAAQARRELLGGPTGGDGLSPSRPDEKCGTPQGRCESG